MPTDDDLLADLADDVHIASTHPDSGVCHGNNDGCEGGPGKIDHEMADRIYARVAMPDGWEPAGKYDDPDVWEAHLVYSMGYVARDDAEARGVLGLWPDEDAIQREYGDSEPREVIVARRSSKPQPQHPGSEFYRLGASHYTVDRVTLTDDVEGFDEPASLLLLWEAAIGAATRLNLVNAP